MYHHHRLVVPDIHFLVVKRRTSFGVVCVVVALALAVVLVLGRSQSIAFFVATAMGEGQRKRWVVVPKTCSDVALQMCSLTRWC